jgi:hypothetical protein
VTLAACGTTHLARPVGAGNTRVSGSLGGPVVVLGGAPIPVPLVTVGVAHGFSDAVDLHADLHPLALAFNPPTPGSMPILGADMGLAVHPIPGYRTALTLGANVYGFTNRVNGVVFSDLWLAGGGRVLPWLTLTGGLHNTVRLGSNDAELNKRLPWQGTLFLNSAFRIGRVELDLELRWMAFTENAMNTAPAYVSFGPFGSLGVLLGFHYTFGGP